MRRAEFFLADFDREFRWYADEAGWEVAQRFLSAVDATLESLARHPGLGRRRRFRHSMLVGLRSFRVERPFNRLLVFYREEPDGIEAWRLMHGARDLSRRLVEPPAQD